MAFDGTYPAPPGNKKTSIIDVVGPASYTQVTPGTPPTGGQLISASEFGLINIESVYASGSDNGQYEVVVIQDPHFLNNPSGGVRLLWKVAATGAEVVGATPLSTQLIRLTAIGN